MSEEQTKKYEVEEYVHFTNDDEYGIYYSIDSMGSGVYWRSSSMNC